MFKDIKVKYKDNILLNACEESKDGRAVVRPFMEANIKNIMLAMLDELRDELIQTCYNAMDTPYLHHQDLIRVVVNGQETIPSTVMEKLGHLARANNDGYGYVIKIIGLEFYSPMMIELTKRLRELVPYDFANVTIQGYWSSKNSLSYPMHLDADEVVLVMLEGTKQFKMGADDYHHLEDNKTLYVEDLEDVMYIPPYRAHTAINTMDNLMLSIGFEYPSVDKLNYMD